MIGSTLLNRYKIEAELGKGGMGIVYKAHDILLNRAVAIKFLNTSGVGTQGKARLLKEARATARLNHPNIVSVYDAGEADGSFFIVMEFVSGDTLRKTEKPSLPDALLMARQICLALEHAHTNGIIHRDLKLENIVITHTQTLKLMDFGLAHAADEVRLTEEGAVMGTLAYLAPELIQGQSASAQSDLYALGVILYELFAGKAPFQGTITTIIAQHMQGKVTPPSEINSQLPAWADDLILRLLSKRPEDRPASAKDVLLILEQNSTSPVRTEIFPGQQPKAQKLKILLLGGLQITRADAPITDFISNKVPALLAYLAVTRRAHTRDKLAALLWGEMSDADAKNNLRQALTNLRKIAEDELTITRDSIEFTGDCFLDSTQFDSAIRSAASLDTSTSLSASPEPASVILTDSLALYRGDFLEGFFVRDAPDFEDWMLSERARLRELALQALHTLTQFHTSRGHFTEAMTCAARLLAFDPWREEAHRQLMLLRARTGQWTAALAQYEICKKILEKELGVQPSLETTALYERIRAARQTSRHNIPASSTEFVGREKELENLRQRLADPACRLVTLTGLGGAGKTRLAQETARLCADMFINGAWMIPLAAVESQGLIPAIGNAFDFPFTKGDAKKQLLNYLRQKELLLVMDNFEHLLDSSALVTEILQAAPEAKILVTSRERLDIDGEWIVELPGLAIGSSEADQLFVQSAKRARAEGQIEEKDKVAVAEICRLVGGLPLGIEIAAAWTRSMNCESIRSEIQKSLDFLESTRRDIPERQRSLRAVFESSWARLSEAEQKTFAALSVFRGGFMREAAQRVAGTIASLVDKSLVQRNGERFELHELVRQFAEEKLSAKKKARAAHATYFADFLAAREPSLRNARQAAILAEIEAEVDNVRLMWRHAIEHNDADIFSKALMGFYWIFDLQGRPAEAIELLSSAAARFEHDPSQAALYSQLLARQITFFTVLSEFERAEAVCQRVISLSQEAGDASTQAFAVRYQGYFAMVRGDLQESKALMSRCLDLYRSLEDAPGMCDALTSLALVLNNLGEYEAARQNLLEAVERATAIQDEISRSVALSNLGGNAYYMGQFETARGYFQASYEIDAAHNDRRRMAVNLHNLACVACDLREWSTALQIQQDALALFTDVAQQEGTMHCRQNLARIMLGLDDLAEARRHLNEAFQVALQIGAVRDSLEIGVIGAELLRREGRFERAAQVIGRVLRHSAATASVKEDARTALGRLDAGFASIAESQPENATIHEMVEAING